MAHKVAVMTGSHKGLGYAIAFIDEVEQSKYIHHRMTVAY
jgi:putative NADH-flavin reductase